jgi:hypothetical protein
MIKYLAVAACALWLIGPASAQEGAKKEAPKTIVLDVSKLPPEAVERLLKLVADKKADADAAGTKKPDPNLPGTKKPAPDAVGKKKPEQGGAWSLGIAVTMAEKSGKTVVKAERIGDEFVLEVADGDKKETVKVPVTKAPEGAKKVKPGPDGVKKPTKPDGEKKPAKPAGEKPAK